MKIPDIDIDFANRDTILGLVKHIQASRLENNELVKHNTGIYLHEVPYDCVKNISSLSYDQAEEIGFFKIDFLNVHMYKDIRNEKHLISLMEKDPIWELLCQDDFSDLLFHVNGHGEIIRKTQPKNIDQLAAVLAMIRPAKRYLLDKSWDEIFRYVWEKPNNGEYYWKKSHAYAYAQAIIVQMNLICEQANADIKQ